MTIVLRKKKRSTLSTLLAKFGTNAHAWLPGANGVSVSGLPTNNYLLSDASTGYSSTDSVVGLVLDGLGSFGENLVTNGDFSGPTSYFSNAYLGGSGSIVAGQLVVTASGGNYTGVQGPLSYHSPNAVVHITANLVSGTGRFTLDFPGEIGVLVNIDRTGPYTFSGVAKLRSDGVFVPNLRTAVSGQTTVWDNISVREITGIPISQATNNNKPILRLNSGKYSWSFDGSNDSLLTGNLGITNTVTVVIAGVLNTLPAVSLLVCEDANGARLGVSSTGAVSFDKNGVAALVATAAGVIVAGVPFVLTARLQAGNADIRKAGAQIATAASALTFSASTGMRIGTRFDGVTDPCNGSIFAVQVITATTTDADCLAIERLVAQQAGITI